MLKTALVFTLSLAMFAPALNAKSAAWKPVNAIDVAVLASLQARGMQPAPICSDEVFVRRVYLDVIGTPPTPKETLAFLNNPKRNKRAALIDELLSRDEFADYWSLKWCDLLRVKAEFPINLWPNAVQAYDRWIHDALRTNMPYDQFTRELLTSSGSNFRVPAVNFYRAVSGRDPDTIAKAVALTFMGTRLEGWPEEKRVGMAAFFSRLTYKSTLEWKEVVVLPNPAPGEPFDAIFPDGTRTRIEAGQDPRLVFADWLIRPENPWFTRNIVNRAWSWFMGRGVIHEPDDIRPDNPPSNPALLAALEKEMIRSGYNMRALFRAILNSHTYQQSCMPAQDGPLSESLFAHYPVRQLPAEVLIDVFTALSGTGPEYSSPIPEPFTFIPPEQRSILLADGSITSPFLEMFGRPPRDTGLESERKNRPTGAQQIFLLNSNDIQRRIERSPVIVAMLTEAKWDRKEVVRQMYLLLLSRYPTPAEAQAAEEYIAAQKKNFRPAVNDLAWALTNSKEFLYRH